MFQFSILGGKFWAKVGLTLVLVGASLVGTAQSLSEMPAFEVGDKWTYREQNVGDRKEPFIVTSQAFKSDMGSGWLFFDIKKSGCRAQTRNSAF